MMKDDYRIVSYKKVDEHLDTIISLHKEISINTKLYGRFIYFDENFREYLSNIIEKSDNDFFFIIKFDDKLCGFVHLKILDETIFLNNIGISESFQGKGLGKILLAKSLNELDDTKITSFSLDVFLSNQKAYKWYNRLGLEEINRYLWKEFHEILITDKSKLLIELKDVNGFNSVFDGEIKVATIINDDTVIVHDAKSLHSINLKNRSAFTNLDLLPEFSSSYSICEISVRMSGNIDVVKNKLETYA